MHIDCCLAYSIELQPLAVLPRAEVIDANYYAVIMRLFIFNLAKHAGLKTIYAHLPAQVAEPVYSARRRVYTPVVIAAIFTVNTTAG